MKKSIFILATFLSLIARTPAAEEFAADELLVSFQPGARGAQADGLRAGIGASKITAWPEINAEHWKLPPGFGIARAIQALSRNPNVVYAEPNYIVHANEIPNDPLRMNLWGFYNLGVPSGTVDADSDVFEAWQVLHDANSVVVGVIDSGVDYTHPDLAANIWTNSGEMGTDSQGRNKASNGIDDDGNGYVDDWHGWDFANNDNDPMDDYGHGTHVAGTIGAVGNNGLGVAGVAWSVKLMPLKFLGANGSGYISAAVSAMLYAAKFVDASGNKQVRIDNASYGIGSKSKSEENAIKTCGALLVAAAGNNASSTAFYPAAYAQPNIISVAATDRNDALASFSNFGSWVAVAAPGVDILSTTRGGNYGSMSGTSMATPHVAGIAALVLAQNPAWSNTSLKAQILNTADSVSGLAGKVSTGGRVNAARAVGANEFPEDSSAPVAITDLTAAPASPYTVTLTWSAPVDDGLTGSAYYYDIRYSQTPITTDTEFQNSAQATGEPLPQSPGNAETFTVTGLGDNKTWYFAIKSVDLAGNASEFSNLATATTPLSDWLYVRLDWGYGIGEYVSQAVNSTGYWAVAYQDTAAQTLKCAFLIPPGYGFRQETVMSGGGNPSVAYNLAGDICISHRYGSKLMFSTRIGSNSWNNVTVESKDIVTGDTSLAFNSSGTAFISYPKGGRLPGLYVARSNGGSWTTQRVDSGAKSVYNELAIDPSGNPAVIYSHDADANGVPDVLNLARFDGSTWTTVAIDSGGLFPTLAFNPLTGDPAMVHYKDSAHEMRYLRWDGSAWLAEIVENAPVTGCSLQFDADGLAYVAYGKTEMLLAKRDLAGAWTGLSVDPSTSGSIRNSLRGRPGGKPGGVVYMGPNDPGYQVGPDPASSRTVRLAIRKTAYP